MSDSQTAPASSSGKSPSHYVYHVRDINGQQQKSFWTRIGAAWAHNDGNGFNLQVECVPLDGRLTIRIATDKQE